MTARSAAFRLALYYAAIFAAMGIHLPFWPLWLKDRGLSPTEIGVVMAATYLTRLAGAPVIGHVVDRRGDRKRPMLVLALLAGLAWMLFQPAHGLAAITAVTVLAVGLWAGLMPIGDSLAMMVVHTHRLDYGRVRLWGSLSFIAVATLAGKLLLNQPPALLVWLVSGALLLTAASCLGLPDVRVPADEGKPVPLAPLLRQPTFLLFLAAAALNNAAHTVYYAFATIHWKAAGLSDAVIGLLWSEGVVAEVVLFAFSGRVVRRIGPAGLILIAGLAGVVRWLVLGSTAQLGWVAASQLLHAATFGCAHLGAMHFIPRAAPAGQAVRAQGTFSAVAVGLVPGLMTPFTGRLYELLAGGSFLAMAGLSAASAGAAWLLLRRWRGGKLAL
jgi:MFS transporter, PPP family, 3-phenylpropionic acid transporter